MFPRPYSIFESATDSPTLKSLVTLLHRQEFKDAKRQKAMANSLMVLAQADRIPDELKHKLLQAALPSSSGKDAARALAEPASIIECLALLAQQDTTFGNTVLERLASIQNPDDFNKQMEMLFNDLFQLQQSDAQKAREQFNRYWEQSRQPAGLLSYAAKIKMNKKLDDDDKESVLEALSQFVNAAVFSPEPEQAFRQLRYDPAASDHLRTLADKAPAAFAQWQRRCIHQPTDASLAQEKQFKVVDTDAAEDLFLCGTEVDSCQSIHTDVFVNKELMGYVLDGKYRMLAIKSADERLMGRRMLRLLWDEQAQQPVLHLEKSYQNPGLPEKYEQALVELVWQKAQQMGCKLVSHDEALKSDGDYDGTLKANPTPWPYEYVDAQALGVQAGRDGYELWDARCG